MHENSLRLRVARVLLCCAFVLMIAALPLPWVGDLPVWMLFRFVGEWGMGIVRGSTSARVAESFFGVLMAVSFLSLACPWFIGVLAGNALLRWFCRVCAVAAFFLIMNRCSLAVSWDYPGVSGVRVFMTVSYLNAAGLCLLPGRKSGLAAPHPGPTA